MTKYNIAIMRHGLTRERVATDEVSFHVRKLATSRLAALEKALPQIKKEVLPLADPTIKFISAYVGKVGSKTGSASRLSPIQIVCETGEIRGS